MDRYGSHRKAIASVYGFDPLSLSSCIIYSFLYFSFFTLLLSFSLFSKPDVFVLDKDWTTKENRKMFLDNLALKFGFDPLIASNWLYVAYKDLKKEVLFNDNQ